MDNLPVTLTVTVGQINFLISQLSKGVYAEVATSIAYLTQEAQKAMQEAASRAAPVNEPPVPE